VPQDVVSCLFFWTAMNSEIFIRQYLLHVTGTTKGRQTKATKLNCTKLN